MAHYHDRHSALDEIRRNIAESGFHIYVVTGSGKPHYGYTIGLRESLGAELILAGAYFYELDEAGKITGASPENCDRRSQGKEDR
jgi:hypothetical protein